MLKAEVPEPFTEKVISRTGILAGSAICCGWDSRAPGRGETAPRKI